MENQHSYDQRQDEGGETARQSQSHPLPPENRQLGRAQIAPVALNSQKAGARERLRTVPFLVTQLAQQHWTAVVQRTLTTQLLQQAPFEFELSEYGNTTKSDEDQAGASEEATSGQQLELSR